MQHLALQRYMILYNSIKIHIMYINGAEAVAVANWIFEEST